MKRIFLICLTAVLFMGNTSFLTEFEMAYSGDSTGSDSFRIPALLTLRYPDGSLTKTVIAVQDVRFTGFVDSPANIDTGIRISRDGGMTFDDHRLLNPFTFEDLPHGRGLLYSSASFIDCSLFQNWSTGRVFVTVNMFPWGGGIMGGNVNEGTPFTEINGEQVMLLSATDDFDRGARPDSRDPRSKSANASDVNHLGTYYVKGVAEFPEYETDKNGSILYDGNGYALLKKPCQRKIFNEADEYTGYFLNERFEVCYDNGTDRGVILQVRQIGSSRSVPMNIAYKRSVFQMYRTSYNYLIYSDDQGKTWSDPINLTGMTERPARYVTYQIASPGTGLYVDRGPYRGRVMFTYYTNCSPDGKVKAEIPCAVWSDDNGKTWVRGNVPSDLGDTGKMSESVLTVMPDGKIRIFSRTSSGHVGTSLSADGGRTWFPAQKIDPIFNSGGSGCQMTAFNYPVKVKGNDVLILASPQSQSGRENGTVWVGLIKDSSGDKIDWNGTQIHSGDFAYSSAAPVAVYSADGLPAVALYSERESGRMHYAVFPFEKLKY